jgi:hypothetical protein
MVKRPKLSFRLLVVLGCTVLFADISAPVAIADTDVSDNPNEPAPVEDGLHSADPIEADAGLEIDPGGGWNDQLHDQSGTYNRFGAAAYALQYVGDTRENHTRSTSGYNSNYVVFPNDCQNFVSQALRAGGWTNDLPDSSTDSGPFWFYFNRLEGWSTSWSAVSRFMQYAQHATGRGRFVRYWSQVTFGDVVMVDWGNLDTPGPDYHSMIVTDVNYAPGHPEFDIKLTYHTNNRLHKSLNALKLANPNARWWAYHVYGPRYD